MGEVKEEVRRMLCTLTEEEYQAKSKELSRLIREKAGYAEQKAAQSRYYSELIAKAELEIQDILPLIETGQEEREVPVRIEYCKPGKGQKTITRTDTGEITVEEMTAEECQDMFLTAEDDNEDEGGIPFPKPARKAKAN